MKLQLFSLLTACFCAFSLNVSAEEIRDSKTDVTFPSEVSFTQDGKTYNLQATGVATRKKLIVSVYSVAHYLQDAASLPSGDKFDAILNSDKAKQLTIKWVHDAGADKIQSGYEESFKNNVQEPDYSKLQKEIKDYIHFFANDVKKGDEHIIRWAPGGSIEVIINGTKAGSIANNPAFAKALWSLWFGPHSAVDRSRLVSLLK